MPVSVTQDLLTTYKLKTSYYQNTYDAKKDVDEPVHPIEVIDETKEEKEETRIATVYNLNEISF